MNPNRLILKGHFLLIVIVLGLSACKTALIPVCDISKSQNPPGTVELAPNLFIDKTEITNENYREFIYWTRQVYGENAKEVHQIYPDTTVWDELEGHLEAIASKYLHHPAYGNYPVVGVSYDQAQAYAQWRSDRVMQVYLIEGGKIEAYPDESPETAFTIARYFKGEYRNITPDPEVVLYPHYSLPDAETYRKTVRFADSLNALNYDKCVEKNCGDYHLTGCGEDGPPENSFLPRPVLCEACKATLVTQLQDNVREMMAEPGKVFGGSFGRPCFTEAAGKEGTAIADGYTGFRNSCTYQPWKNTDAATR
tara:strand:- start:1310 stop:2236 length:927 start_codon:yes stop_codon:yes gene_type:complete